MSPTKRIAVTRGKLAAAGRILGACEPQSPTPRRPRGGRSRPSSARRRRRASSPSRRRAGAARRASAPVVVPRWIQLVMLPLALLGAVRGRARGRAGAPAVHRRRADRAAAQPARDVAAARSASRAARRWGPSSSCSCWRSTGLGMLLADPVANQVSSFRDNVPGIVDDANASLADLQALARPQRHRPPGHRARPHRARVARRPGRGGLGRPRRVHPRRAAAAGRGLVRGDPDHRPLGLHAALRRAHRRRRRARVVPPGDGTPEDDFPTRIQGAVFGYVRGQLLFSLIMGTSAGICLWILGSLGIFPDGKTYAFAFGAFYGFAELIPYIGPAVGAFPPVDDRAVQPGPARRAVADDHVHGAAADRGPRRRPATCSGTRCGSTPCW